MKKLLRKCLGMSISISPGNATRAPAEPTREGIQAPRQGSPTEEQGLGIPSAHHAKPDVKAKHRENHSDRVDKLLGDSKLPERQRVFAATLIGKKGHVPA